MPQVLRSVIWRQLLKIKVIQQETELDRHIYDQSLSAILLLEDIRKGDIIEYSYTIKGFNTIFKGRYADVYDVGFTVPVYNLYYKMVVPKGRQITIKNSQTNLQPIIKEFNTETIYEWKLANLTSLSSSCIRLPLSSGRDHTMTEDYPEREEK